MSETYLIPVLHGDGVVLRPHAMDDLDAVVERCRDSDSIRWTTVPDPYDEGMGREYLQDAMTPSEKQVSWAIELDGRYAGTIDLRVAVRGDGHGAGELGFVTHPDVRGRGVMSRAIASVLDHAFGTLGWELVWWEANVGNVASYKTVWRNGFPLPVLVPALLEHKGRMLDGWRAVLERDDPREPTVAWEEAEQVLHADIVRARRPG